MDIFDEILEKHTKLCTCREAYQINEDVEIGISQQEESIFMYAYNKKIDRNMSIESNYKKLWWGFSKVATNGHIQKSKTGFTYTLTLKIEEDIKSVVEEIKELSELEQLKLYISELENQIQKLNNENERLLEENNLLKNNTFNSRNSRGAGRKSKFTNEQIKDIKQLRIQGATIKEIAIEYSCSVGLIHKLINES